jgi:hypothetical protein
VHRTINSKTKAINNVGTRMVKPRPMAMGK